MWDFADLGWLAVVAGGPLLIALVVVWGAHRNRQRNERERRITERATHRLYEKEDRSR